MKLTDLLKTIAPTVATVLGGPLAGLAVKTIGDAIGMDEPTQAKIEKALTGSHLTAEQILAIKNADQALIVKLKELDIDVQKIAAADRDSARKREVDTKDWTPKILAAVIVVTWGGVQWYLLRHVIHEDMRELVMRVLGTLDAALMLVLSYYYGASAQPGTVINGERRGG